MVEPTVPASESQRPVALWTDVMLMPARRHAAVGVEGRIAAICMVCVFVWHVDTGAAQCLCGRQDEFQADAVELARSVSRAGPLRCTVCVFVQHVDTEAAQVSCRLQIVSTQEQRSICADCKLSVKQTWLSLQRRRLRAAEADGFVDRRATDAHRHECATISCAPT